MEACPFDYFRKCWKLSVEAIHVTHVVRSRRCDGQTSTGGGQPEFCFAVRKLAAGGNSIEEAILEPGRCVSCCRSGDGP